MQQAAIPKSVVLETLDGEHLGFVLSAVADGANDGKCIFMVLPPNTAIWSTPLVQALFSRKDLGESDIHITVGPPMSLHITSGDLPDLVIALDKTGAGTWHEQPPGNHRGRATVTAAA